MKSEAGRRSGELSEDRPRRGDQRRDPQHKLLEVPQENPPLGSADFSAESPATVAWLCGDGEEHVGADGRQESFCVLVCVGVCVCNQGSSPSMRLQIQPLVPALGSPVIGRRVIKVSSSVFSLCTSCRGLHCSALFQQHQ